MGAMKEIALQDQINEITQYQRDHCPTCYKQATCSGTMTQGETCMNAKD